MMYTEIIQIHTNFVFKSPVNECTQRKSSELKMFLKIEQHF